MNKHTVLFLDIDGVLSIPNLANTNERIERLERITCWPIASSLLRMIEQNRRSITPIWLTAWGNGGWLWNERAGTRRWHVGYHLSKRQEQYIRTKYPALGKITDWKLLAVRYFLRRQPEAEVVWVEDGFTDEVHIWVAQKSHVRLIDTTQPPIRALLLSHEETAIKRFVQTYLQVQIVE